jgi:hypothetical protein
LWEPFEYKDGDEVEITVNFIPEEERYYYKIDDDYMKAQKADISIEKRVLYDDKSLGFIGPNQTMTFIMPHNDVELVIKEVGTIHKLTIRPELYQYTHDTGRLIVGVLVKDSIGETFYRFVEGSESVTIDVIDFETIDIWVKFSDVYQHLDKDYIISQSPTVMILEAGEISSDGDDEIKKPEQILDDNTSLDYIEYYQLIRFGMSDEDFELVLKWEERLFEIDYIRPEAFFTYTSIKDTNKLFGLEENGNQIRFPQSVFPHYSYPVIQKNNIIETNKLVFSPEILQGYGLNLKKSFHKEISTNKIYLEDSSLITTEANGQKYNLSFDMPKYNFMLWLQNSVDVGFPIVEEYSSTIDSMLLDAGLYQVWVCGGRGGQGAGATYLANDNFNSWVAFTGKGLNKGMVPGTQGEIRSFNIELQVPVSITYRIGAQGGDARYGSNNSSGSGGGGAGGTVLSFEQLVTSNFGEVSEIFCKGGNGGKGNQYAWRLSAGWGEYDDVDKHNGGDGGVGGGTGESGDSGWNKPGSVGQGGVGYRSTTFQNIGLTNYSLASSMIPNYQYTGDGFVVIIYKGEI